MKLAETDGADAATGTETEELEQQEGTEQAEAGTGTEAATGTEAEATDDVVVSIGEESPPSDEDENRAPEWVRELRKSNREKDRRIRELEQAQATTAKTHAVITVGDKPTLESCEYDTDRFEKDLEQWHERKRAADAEEQKKQDSQTKAQQAWQAKLDHYGKLKGELKVKDFEDAEQTVRDGFSVTQQGVILSGAENPAVVIYALGKNPKKAKEIASIEDPVKFAFAVAKLETQLKVTPRKAAPLPESTVRGSAPVAGSVDPNLKKLEEEADRTGDRSKVIAYRREQRRKASA
jgi:hypothetical protein